MLIKMLKLIMLKISLPISIQLDLDVPLSAKHP